MRHAVLLMGLVLALPSCTSLEGFRGSHVHAPAPVTAPRHSSRPPVTSTTGATPASATTTPPLTEEPAQEEPAAKTDSSDSCNMSPFLTMIGAKVDEKALSRRSLPYRVIPEGGMMTMDMRRDRLTIHLDDKGRVSAMRCV